VGHGGLTDGLSEFLDGGLQLVGGLPLQPTDHADGDRQAEPVEGELADRTLAQAVAPGQDAEDGPQPWAEGPTGHSRRQDRTGRGAASGARQPMEPVFIHHGDDRRHLGDLVADRFGVITGQSVAAPAASGRLAVDDLADLLGRDQGSGLAMMSGLAAPLLARGGGRRSSLDRGEIGGRWPGGIAGVLVEPLLQFGNRMIPGLLDLKRLSWNLRRFRVGHRKDQTPYGLLGLKVPDLSF
jgi:hypothetical protein